MTQILQLASRPSGSRAARGVKPPSARTMSLRSLVFGLAFSAVASAHAQSPNTAINAPSRTIMQTPEREICVGVPKVCKKVVADAETGEVAKIGDAPVQGFGMEGGRLTKRASVLRTQPKMSDDQVTSSSDALLPPWQEVRCPLSEPSCPRIIVNSRTREIAVYDGKLAAGFIATGNGREVVRDSKVGAFVR